MIVEKGLIDKLKLFGLNSYEAKIWVALLSRGVSSAGELSDISGVPRSRSYDVLESLEKKGFIVMKIGKPIKYIAVPPNEVLERVKTRLKVSAEEQAKNIDTLKNSPVLTELSTLHNDGVELIDPSDLTASFKGRDRVYEQILLMLKTVEEEFILVTSEDGFLRKVDLLSKFFKKAHERGVKIKIASEFTEKSKEALKSIQDFVEVKNMSHIKARFAIADGKEITFLLFDDVSVHPSYDVGIWFNSEYFASALQSMFDAVWTSLETPKILTKN
ncbi:MAG: TrmB family transcriptional regulator [Candidatus Woesearchaeota archaeon]